MLIDVIGVNDGKNLIVIPWLNEGGYTTSGDAEGSDFIAHLIQELASLVVSWVEGLTYEREHALVAKALKEWVTFKGFAVYVDAYCDAELGGQGFNEVGEAGGGYL